MSTTDLSKKLSLGGAVLAALAASSCCIGPLLLAALGLGGAGAFASVARFRPLFLAVTCVALGLGFYLTYRKAPAKEDACGCERPRAGRLPRVMLWVATLFTVLLAVSPTLLAKVSAAHPQSALDGPLEAAIIRVPGIDCEACAAPMRKAMTAAGGFDHLTLDLKAQTITVFYQAGSNRPAAYVRAIEEVGWEPNLVEVTK